MEINISGIPGDTPSSRVHEHGSEANLTSVLRMEIFDFCLKVVEIYESCGNS